jgi:hypothetical protein
MGNALQDKTVAVVSWNESRSVAMKGKRREQR